MMNYKKAYEKAKKAMGSYERIILGEDTFFGYEINKYRQEFREIESKLSAIEAEKKESLINPVINVLQKYIFNNGDIWTIYELDKMYDELLSLIEAEKEEEPKRNKRNCIWYDGGKCANANSPSISCIGIGCGVSEFDINPR